MTTSTFFTISILHVEIVQRLQGRRIVVPFVEFFQDHRQQAQNLLQNFFDTRVDAAHDPVADGRNDAARAQRGEFVSPGHGIPFSAATQASAFSPALLSKAMMSSSRSTSGSVSLRT